MDCVYICRSGDNEELRYSIRSIVKNLPHSKVWIVGYKPDWYTGDFIPVEDISSKFKNITNALRVVCDTEDISDDFILMNDDFFVLKPLDAMPNFVGGTLSEKINEYRNIDPRSRYANILDDTNIYLVKKGIETPMDYDLHVPMIMNRNNLKSVITDEAFPRSTYGNFFISGGEKITDVKAYSGSSSLRQRSVSLKNRDLPFISTEDGSFDYIRKTFLVDKFPEPSQYETI
jgi:hypothetical protein